VSAPNAITQARAEIAYLAEEGRGEALTADQYIARDALTKLDALDHEAALDEWRCPGYREGTCACLCNQPQPIPGPCPCCGRETRHYLVVPFRSDRCDHADA
jgi:rubrerythrin